MNRKCQVLTLKENEVNQNTVQSTGKKSRLFFLDHLRTFLAILVVLHHVALVYGASVQGFYYIEPPFTSPGVVNPLAYLALLVFVLRFSIFENLQHLVHGRLLLVSGLFRSRLIGPERGRILP